MKFKILPGLLLSGLVMWGVSSGQSQTGPTDQPTRIVHVGGMPGDEPIIVTGGPDFQFVSSAPIATRVVKGAPYSLEARIDTTQTLADGNRISHHSTVKMYRDSQGRTRREETFATIGPWTAAGPPQILVTIQDPLAGADYLLDSESKIVTRVPSPPMPSFKSLNTERGTQPMSRTGDTAPARWSNPIAVAGNPGSSPDAVGTGVFSPIVPGPNAGGRYVVNQGYVASESSPAKRPSLIASSSTGKPATPAGKSQSLGKETIAGISAEGTRTSVEIPAGAIGNERSIELVNERWFSSELQIVLRTKQSDPRLGNTEYNVTRLERAEPPHSLFEIPADYQLRNGGVLEGEPR